MKKFEVCIAVPSENWGPELVTVDADKFTYYGSDEPLRFEHGTGQEGCYRTVAAFSQWVYFRELPEGEHFAAVPTKGRLPEPSRN